MEFGFWFIRVEHTTALFFISSPASLPSFFSLSLSTGAAGGRWWVLCSLATPSVDGDWYAALFKCLSPSRARNGGGGGAEQSRPYWSFPTSSSFSLPSHSIVGTWEDKYFSSKEARLNTAVLKVRGALHLWRASRCPRQNQSVVSKLELSPISFTLSD